MKFRITDIADNTTHVSNAAYCISKSMGCRPVDDKRDQVIVPDIFTADDILEYLRTNNFDVSKLKIEKC